MTSKMTSQNASGGVRYQIEADTKEEVEDQIARVYKLYHPMGYGTQFSEPKKKGEKWVSHGTRAYSAD